MVQQFIPLLAMTLAVCWFIVLMQMIFMRAEDIVGRGLDLKVVAELLAHAAVMTLPTATPLGILLASVMTFGGLGERLELLAMKSAGVPLYRIMMPLLWVSITIGVLLFVYLNTAMMNAQVKFFQILFSAQQARPDLEIPQGVFYTSIPNYSLFVKKKDHKHHTLQDVMIYDFTAGSTQPRIMMADSGKLQMDASKTFLTLDLWRGESFEQLANGSFIGGSKGAPSYQDTIPASYIKEKFDSKSIVIKFDTNFKMIDEEGLRSQFVGKNLLQLNRYIRDTAVYNLDSVTRFNGKEAINTITNERYQTTTLNPLDTTALERERIAAVEQRAQAYTLNRDSLFATLTPSQTEIAVEDAKTRLANLANMADYWNDLLQAEAYNYRSHNQERHRKFTFPVACLLFFFIGAPLGALIRKGGIGMPLIASILLFVVYYMVDTLGFNLSYNGTWPIWLGMWFSTFILLPIGAFLTYEASRDSVALNISEWFFLLKKLIRPERIREISVKELILDYVTPQEAIALIQTTQKQMQQVTNNRFVQKHNLRYKYLQQLNTQYAQTAQGFDHLVARLQNSDNKLTLAKLMDIPKLPHRFAPLLPKHAVLYGIGLLLLPLSIPYLWYLLKRRNVLVEQWEQTARTLQELEDIYSGTQNTTPYNKISSI